MVDARRDPYPPPNGRYSGMSVWALMVWMDTMECAPSSYLMPHHKMPLVCYYLGNDFTDAESFLKHHPTVQCDGLNHFSCQCPAPLTWRLSGF